MYSHCSWFLASLWIYHVSGQTMVNITDPLVGNSGGSVQIACSAFDAISGMRVYSDPGNIVLRRNDVVFSSGRLSSNTDHPVKTYTLEDLQRSDDGIRLQCSFFEILSPEVILWINYTPEISNPTGPLVTDSTARLVEGEETTISFTIDARPTPTNTIQQIPGSVPPSLTVSNNTVIVNDVGRNDQGTYSFVSSNSAGSSQIQFTIVVEYAPIFNDTVSTEFMCNSSVEPLSCASRVGQTGSFSCAFQSNPAGSLNTTIDVGDATNVRTMNSMIIINDVSPDNVGNYSCTAYNTIRGQLNVLRKEIRLLVGDVPAAVTDGNATVTEESVTIRWTYNEQRSIPLSGFTVVGGRIDSNTRTIDLMVAANVFQVTLDRDMLDMTDYRVTIRAINLLGESEGRDTLFRVPITPTSPTTTSEGHKIRPISYLLSITLTLLCHLFCRH